MNLLKNITILLGGRAEISYNTLKIKIKIEKNKNIKTY